MEANINDKVSLCTLQWMYSYVFNYLVPTRSVRDIKKCRKILQRAVQSASDNPEMVIQALLSFEREEGEWNHAL